MLKNKISVVIILKNDLGVVDTLNALYLQEYDGDFEIIVVDRSTIQYDKLVLSKNVKWIKYENDQKRYTIPEQRNIGISESNGDIVVFIDASCIPERNWLGNITKLILSGEESIVMGKTGSTGTSTTNDNYHKRLENTKYVDEAPTINLAINRKVFDIVGLFDENLEYGSDVDWTWRAVELKYKIRYVPSAYVTHDWGSISDEVKRNILYGKARARLLIKHINHKWRNLLGLDSLVIVYPLLILSSPLIWHFPWILISLILLLVRNYKEPKPLEIIAKHFVYGYGVLIEVKNQVFHRLLGASKTVEHSFTEILSFTILSIYGYGLFVNALLPILGINNPLSITWIWPVYILCLPILIKLISELVRLFSANFTSWLKEILILALPFVAITGVLLLDNRNNPLGTILLVIISIIIFITTLFAKSKESLYKYAIFSVTLSLILANSMRSNYLVGWDIHQEYEVFKLTLSNSSWNIDLLRDAYNACLSITILPTILSNLFKLNEFALYKLVIPGIISCVPLIVYQISKNFVSSKLAFVAAFAFLLQTQFISQMPALLRQGIAFIFFASILNTIIRNDLSKKTRNIYIVLFGLGLIFSHYSTNYIWMLVYGLTIIVECLLSILGPLKNRRLSIGIFLLLLVASIMWNVIITNTAGGLVSTLNKVFNNISQITSLENKSEAVRGAIYSQSNEEEKITKYYETSLNNLPDDNDYKNYPIFFKSLQLNTFIKLTDPVPAYFHLFVPWSFRILIILGLFVSTYKKFKVREHDISLILSYVMVGVVFLIMVLPFASQDYNFERLFQQMLVLLVVFSVIGGKSLLNKEYSHLILYAILFSSYLIKNTGLIDQTFYMRSFWMFDNSGEQFYRYFTVKSEIDSLNWFDRKLDVPILLYTDRYTKLRAKAYSDLEFIYLSSQLNPVVIEKYGYILAGNAANSAGVVFADSPNFQMTINFQKDFFENKYNKVYSNNSSTIYK